MPLQENLNVAPYYADYNPLADYYTMLFKAGFPIQARELTNMQLMQQNQLEQFMSRFMKEGDNIVPGERAYGSPAYVRVQSITLGATANEFIGYTLTGAVSGVQAVVQFATAETSTDDTTFYVSYESQGTTSDYTTFVEGETLLSNTPNAYTASVGVTGVSKPLTIDRLGVSTPSPAMGRGTVYTVKEGYYYTMGQAVRNVAQTIVLDKYDTIPSYQVGFLVTEQFISSEEDPALLDNSQGSSNFAAPGADRLKITLTLTKLAQDQTVDNFIQLANIQQGVITTDPTNQQKWQWLYDVLAKRTFDESGDYIITEFPIILQEYYNKLGNKGLYDADANGTYPPVPGSGETVNLTLTEASANYVLKVSPGEAYVQGFNVGNNKPVYLYGDKPRTPNFRDNVITPIQSPYNMTLTSLYGSPTFDNSASVIESNAFQSITMYRNFNDGYVGQSFNGTTHKPMNSGHKPPTTYHIMTDGDIGDVVVGNGIKKVIYRSGRGAVLELETDYIAARYNGASPANTINQLVDPSGNGTVNILIALKITPSPAGTISPRYLHPQNIFENVIDRNDAAKEQSFNGFDSTYELGIFRSEFFEEFAIIKDTDTINDNADWVVGDIVYGDNTSTYGVVEEGTTKEILILSQVVGKIEPGDYVTQTLADGSEKVGRVALIGDPIGFEFPTSGDSGQNMFDLSEVTTIAVQALGNQRVLSKTSSTPEIEYDAATNSITLTPAGRAILRDFPFPPTTADERKKRINIEAYANHSNGSDVILGYVVTIPSTTINSQSKTKSLFSDLRTPLNFTADIAIEDNQDTEFLPVASGAMFKGTKDDNKLICEIFNGDPSQDLVFGDLISFSDGVSQQSHLVLTATQPIGYAPNRTRAIIYLTTPLVADVSSAVVNRVRLKTKGQPTNSLIFQLPQQTVASLQSNPKKTGINYFVMQQFETTATENATTISLNTDSANEQFIQSRENVMVTVFSTNDVEPEELGRQLTVHSVATANNDTQITITLATDSQIRGQNTKVVVLLPVRVTNAKAKTKILKERQTLTIPAAEAKKKLISLRRADVLMVREVLLAPDDIDIRDRFRFDNGQRDNFYGISTLQLNLGAAPIDNDITVIYDYYEHSGTGDFFSVDSYIAPPNATADQTSVSTPYEAVPMYQPISIIPLNSENSPVVMLQLRDCIDFRPIVNTLGTLDSDPNTNPTYIPGITDGYDSTDAVNFRGATNDGNGFAPRIPLVGTNFECNLAYYLPKIDSLFMERDGSLTLVKGVPAEEPVAPPNLATGIRLYDFRLPAYTFTTKSIKVEKYNYKNYTMKDIVGLERRISRLEELVTLSLLEQSALNMNVKDAVTGLDRFKNGIIVDEFADHSQGTTTSRYYSCSVDPKTTHLRPAFYANQCELIERSQTNTERAANGYRKEGPQIMLDYRSERFLQNPFATRIINLQPYSVFTYNGEVELTPAIDTWQDITQKPDLVIQDTNVYDAMLNMSQEMASSGLGTVWGEWETTGVTKTEVTRENVGKGMDSEERAMAVIALQAMGIQFTDNTADILAGLSPEAAAGRQRSIDNGWVAPIAVTTTTKSEELKRQQTQTVINVSTGAVKETSYGQRITDVTLARTMRSRAVAVQAGRLKPNTRYYVYFDDINVSEWFAVDEIQTLSAGLKIYRGAPGQFQAGFGEPIISDDIGNLSGVFIVPNGRPPVSGQKFGPPGLEGVQYQTTGETRSFNTGTRKFRITSSATDRQDLTQIEGFAETTYTASGVIMDKEQTIVATTTPSFTSQTNIIDTDTRWEVNEEQSGQTAEYYDPVAQTFMIDSRFNTGLFVSELDVFFQQKDERESVEAYLVTTDGQVPTEKILPYSKVIKPTNTTLRVICKLGSGLNSETIKFNTTVTGSQSGATGIMRYTMTFNSATADSTNNVDNTTYDMILKNYNGEFIPGETLVPETAPASTSTFTIAQDEFVIDYVDITALGKDYSNGNTSVTFSAPQLPGGVTATGTVKVGSDGSSGEGKVYEIDITNVGTGYTKVPTVSIADTRTEAERTTIDDQGQTVVAPAGSGALALVKVKSGESGVEMGVSTSEDGTSATTFRFQTPIYLMGDTTYAFVVKAPTSLNYLMWTSKLGENRIGTTTRVVSQPSLGSLFMSQNGGLWTEDQTQDVKFVMRRSVFTTNQSAVVTLNNGPTEKELIGKSGSPIRTSNNALVGDSELFGSNPRVVMVNLPGASGMFNTGDLVAIEGVTQNVGGIDKSEFNTLHEVLRANKDGFFIKTKSAATSTTQGGGYSTRLSPNRPYETINVNTGAMTFGPCALKASTTSTFGLSGSMNSRVVDGTKVDSARLSNLKYTRSNAAEIDLLESYYYNFPRTVLNPVNQALYNTNERLRGQNSLDVAISLISTKDSVSPVINLERTNATVIRNCVDDVTSVDPVYGAPVVTMVMAADTTTLTDIVANSPITFTNAKGVARTVNVVSKNNNTRRIKVQGTHANELLKSHTITTSNVATIGVSSVSTQAGDFYYPETTNSGSAWARFISRLYVFEDSCDGIQLKLSSCIYEKTSLRCYYRLRDVGYDGDIAELKWVPFNPEQFITIASADPDQQYQIIDNKQKVPGLPDNINQATVRDADNVNPYFIGESGWQSLIWSAQDLPSFDAIQIKIVMHADNPALCPLIDDMQIICSE